MIELPEGYRLRITPQGAIVSADAARYNRDWEKDERIAAWIRPLADILRYVHAKLNTDVGYPAWDCCIPWGIVESDGRIYSWEVTRHPEGQKKEDTIGKPR